MHKPNSYYLIFCFAASVFALVWLFLLISKGKQEGKAKSLANHLYVGQVMGIFSGLAIRLWFTAAVFFKNIPGLQIATSLVSIGFLFLSPFVIGLITEYFAPQVQERKWWRSLFDPWAALLVSIAIAILLGLEGIICVIMVVPLWLLLCSLGGLTGFFLQRRMRRNSAALFSFVLFLPALFSFIESPFPSPLKVQSVTTSIQINATKETVWNEIKSVRRIEANEHSPSLYTTMGFPRPVEAVLIGDGLGAVRKASFEGGVLFTETITEWKEPEIIEFSIRADTEQIPATTLDEHVKIGGPFFDMLVGRYEIEAISPNKVTVHLSSSHRLSTKINWYASLWTEAVMQSIQKNILEIIKRRCERG